MAIIITNTNGSAQTVTITDGQGSPVTIASATSALLGRGRSAGEQRHGSRDVREVPRPARVRRHRAAGAAGLLQLRLHEAENSGRREQ